MKIKYTVLSIAVAWLAAGLASPAAAQSSFSYAGGTYTQNFDSLPYTSGTSVNTANPATIGGTTYSFATTANGVFDFGAAAASTGSGGLGLSSTMAGWYGGAATLLKYGASPGDQTTGGIISFGALSGTDRSLGLLATSTTGVTTFGFQLVNNTASTIDAINLSYTGELWRQTGTAKTVGLGYEVVSSVSANMPLTGTTALSGGTISFSTGTNAGANTAPVATDPINLSDVSITGGTLDWTPGSALWLTWQISSSAGSGQGIGINNLSFSTPGAVPEPGTWGALAGVSSLGVVLLKRRMQRKTFTPVLE